MLIIGIIFVLLFVQTQLLQVMTQNNVFTFAQIYLMILLLIIIQKYAWTFVRLALLEVHKICIAFNPAGGQIMQILLLIYVFKYAPLVILQEIKLLLVIKIVVPILMLNQILEYAYLNVLFFIIYLNMIKVGPVYLYVLILIMQIKI